MKNIRINQSLIIVMKSLIFTIISICVLELMLLLIRKAGLQIEGDSLTQNVLLEVVILIVQCLIIRKYEKEKLLASMGLGYQRNAMKYMFTGISLGLIGVVLIYSTVLFRKIVFYEGLGFKFYNTEIVISFILSLFIRAIFASVCEEVFFRGVLLNYLAKVKGTVFGIIVSSVIFAVFHTTRYQNFNQLFSVLFAGVVLGYIYIKTKSLYMSVGLHFATDFFISIIGTKSEVGFLIFDVNSNFGMEYLTQSIFALISIMYLILFIILTIVNEKI